MPQVIINPVLLISSYHHSTKLKLKVVTMSPPSFTPYLKTSDIPISTTQTNSKSLVNKRILFTICLATAVSTFDFMIYAFMSDTLGKAFFPEGVNDYLGKVKTIAFLAVGFIAPLIGGFWFGRYGDKQGRLPVLRIAMSLFLITTLSAALMPTYASIGLFASVSLVIIRLVQGAAFAILAVLGFVFVAESLPRHKLAFNVSLVVASFIPGILVASLLTELIIQMLSEQQLLTYGWRLTFLVSAILSGITFLFIRQLDETPLFLAYTAHSDDLSQDTVKDKDRDKDKLPPSSPAINATSDSQAFPNTSNHKSSIPPSPKSNLSGAIVINGFLEFISSSVILMICLLLPELLAMRFVIDEEVLGIANMCGMIGLMIGIVFYGGLADKITAARTLMLGSVILSFLALTLFSYLSHDNAAHIIIGYSLLGLGSGVIAMCPLMFIQLYSTSIRLTMTGVIYNIATVLTGVIVPFALYYATDIIALTPALFIIFICGCAFMIGKLINSSPNMNKLEPMP